MFQKGDEEQLCYKPCVIIQGKYSGSLQNKLEKTKLNNTAVQKLVESGAWAIVPCQQCLQCRQASAANWAARIEKENSYYEYSYFLTLTYNDENLPVHNIFEDSYYHGLVNPVEYTLGRTIERPYIEYHDLQQFMNSLRKHAKNKSLAEVGADGKACIRFFACGEYGDQSQRPHFHCIIFGLKIPDLEHHFSKNGYEHFTSKAIDHIWGKGIVDIGSVTYHSARYVAQYVIKKQKGQEGKIYKEAGITAPDVRMSLKPGIGYRYWDENREEIYKHDRIYLSEGRKQRPPRYFDIMEDRKRLEEEEREIESFFKENIDIEEKLPKMESNYMKELKKQRRTRANDALFNKLRQTSGLSLNEYFENIGKRYEENHKLALDRGHENKS